MASNFSNTRWVALSQGARVVSQLVSMTVLARLLAPDAYGLMALAAIVTNLAYLFRDMGTGAALIQAATVSPRMASTVHWTNIALGLLIGVAIAISAPLTAQVFREPQLATVLLLLAVVFPITGAAVVHQALLERDSKFAVVAGAEVAAALVGVGVALLLAWRGAGVFSLVGQMIASTVVSTTIISVRSTFRPDRHWQLAEFKAIARFSGNLSLFNVVLYISRNADSMVVGRMLGTVALGGYAMAYRLMLFPLQNMTFVVARVLFPVMSRKQGDTAEVVALYLRALGFIAFLSAPLMAGLFALRAPFVQVMLGERWQASVVLLAWLAPVGFIQSLVSSTGTVLMARGCTDLMLRLGLVGAVLQVGAVAIGARWGVEGVAAGYLVANLLNAVPALYFCARQIGIGFGALLRAIAPAVAAAVFMVLALRASAPLVTAVTAVTATTAATSSALLALLLQIAIGVIAYGAASLVLLRPQLLSLRSLIGLHKKAEA
ncbi:lipopolysaccharide biosynthesis protein [Massilia sp. PWRC2]|uniref:lipopolysaccharide biosynthesis protein n=1 Tax=Massilia sp. PWRC2 TaxID=2804626 RepID=UPI003CEFF2C5